jgi:predicted DNA-binding ribbon-helix-helix protein
LPLAHSSNAQTLVHHRRPPDEHRARGRLWSELTVLAEARRLSLSALVAEIDNARGESGNLASALRLHVLETLKRKISRA